MIQRVAVNAATAVGAWGIQVGAFANLATAQAAADNARAVLPVLLRKNERSSFPRPRRSAARLPSAPASWACLRQTQRMPARS